MPPRINDLAGLPKPLVHDLLHLRAHVQLLVAERRRTGQTTQNDRRAVEAVRKLDRLPLTYPRVVGLVEEVDHLKATIGTEIFGVPYPAKHADQTPVQNITVGKLAAVLIDDNNRSINVNPNPTLVSNAAWITGNQPAPVPAQTPAQKRFADLEAEDANKRERLRKDYEQQAANLTLRAQEQILPDDTFANGVIILLGSPGQDYYGAPTVNIKTLHKTHEGVWVTGDGQIQTWANIVSTLKQHPEALIVTQTQELPDGPFYNGTGHQIEDDEEPEVVEAKAPAVKRARKTAPSKTGAKATPGRRTT